LLGKLTARFKLHSCNVKVLLLKGKGKEKEKKEREKGRKWRKGRKKKTQH